MLIHCMCLLTLTPVLFTPVTFCTMAGVFWCHSVHCMLLLVACVDCSVASIERPLVTCNFHVTAVWYP